MTTQLLLLASIGLVLAVAIGWMIGRPRGRAWRYAGWAYVIAEVVILALRAATEDLDPVFRVWFLTSAISLPFAYGIGLRKQRALESLVWATAFGPLGLLIVALLKSDAQGPRIPSRGTPLSP